jgi:hypothetical protein
MFAECVGQDLEVFEILVFGGCVELDAAHGKVEEDTVVDLAKRSAVVDCAVSQMFMRRTRLAASIRW